MTMINENVFKNYLSFLNNVHDMADMYIKKNKMVVPSTADLTQLQLRIISDKDGEAKKVAKRIDKLIITHKVWIDSRGSICEAANEMEQIRSGAIRYQNKVYAIMIDSSDIDSIAEKMDVIQGDFDAMCFVKVDDDEIVQNGGWEIPGRWLGVFMRLKGCFKYGVYFVIDKLCFQSEYEDTVAATLITVSQMFDKSRSAMPENPVRLTGKPDQSNTFALVSVSSVNVCRIGVLLTCAVKLMKKCDSSQKDDNGLQIERTFDEICNLDEFHKSIEKVHERILLAVNTKAVLSQMASMPLDGGCESRLNELRSSQKVSFLGKIFGAKQEQRNTSLRSILGIAECDTRYSEYFNERVTKVWEEALDRWFQNDENVYSLFYDLINCFVDFKCASSNLNCALNKVIEAHKEAHKTLSEDTAEAVFADEKDIREVAENYVAAVYGVQIDREKAALFSKIIDKLLSFEISEKYNNVINELVEKSLNVSNSIWDEYHNEIIGFCNGINTGSNGLSRDGSLYEDHLAGSKLLDVPDIASFKPNENKIAQMCEALSKGIDNVPCTIKTFNEIPTLFGEWKIVDNDNNVVESYEDGKICFVVRRTDKHGYYSSFDKQRVIRVKLNIYSLENDSIEVYKEIGGA